MANDDMRCCWCGKAHHRLVCKQGSGCAPCEHHRKEYRRVERAHKNMMGSPPILRSEEVGGGG